MTNAEMAILNLVAEQPLYGYQIEQLIEQRGMRQWADIGFSSIYYILNKLEGTGWLESEKQSESDRPARKVYHLAGGGAVALAEAVRQRLSAPRMRSGDLDLALASLPALPLSEALSALRLYQQQMQTNIRQVTHKEESDRQVHLPFHAAAIFEHSLALMQAELAWVTQFIAQLELLSALSPSDGKQEFLK